MFDSDIQLSFVVPLYFTGDGIDRLLDAFRDLRIGPVYEVVLVNDGSTDNTLENLQSRVPGLPYPVVCVDLARNYGEHAAVMEGLRQSRGRFVVTMDDDLQNPVEEALLLYEHARDTKADVVYSYYASKKHHPLRNLGSWFTNAVASFCIGKPRDLYLCSFRCLRRDLVDRVVLYTGPFPYIDGLILNATNRIGRLQVRHDARSDGTSGYTLRRLVRLWMNMFFNFSIMPLRIASVAGMLLCGLGGVLAASVVVEYFFMTEPPLGWSSLMAAIALFSGSQLLILGLFGEYLGRTYLTLAGKPQSLARSVQRHR